MGITMDEVFWGGSRTSRRGGGGAKRGDVEVGSKKQERRPS